VKELKQIIEQKNENNIIIYFQVLRFVARAASTNKKKIYLSI